jgi:predicted flap endonuclease-1-like 5' DNA nuclease
MKTIEVQGIGPANGRKLALAGIRTTEALLKKGASDKGRKEIAARSGISHALVLRWVNHADLFRIIGIGPQYAEILEKAGVDTVAELSKRAAGTLYEKVVAANRIEKLVRKMPSRQQIEDWIAAARKLPRLISY